MLITDEKIDKDAALAKHVLVVPVASDTNLTDVPVFSCRPGFNFEVVDVQSSCRAKVGTVTAKVVVGVAGDLRDATPPFAFTAGPFSTNETVAPHVQDRRGSSGDNLQVALTTDATGSLTGGFVTITIRPRAMRGDAGA